MLSLIALQTVLHCLVNGSMYLFKNIRINDKTYMLATLPSKRLPGTSLSHDRSMSCPVAVQPVPEAGGSGHLPGCDHTPPGGRSGQGGRSRPLVGAGINVVIYGNVTFLITMFVREFSLCTHYKMCVCVRACMRVGHKSF